MWNKKHQVNYYEMEYRGKCILHKNIQDFTLFKFAEINITHQN